MRLPVQAASVLRRSPVGISSRLVGPSGLGCGEHSEKQQKKTAVPCTCQGCEGKPSCENGCGCSGSPLECKCSR